MIAMTTGKSRRSEARTFENSLSRDWDARSREARDWPHWLTKADGKIGGRSRRQAENLVSLIRELPSLAGIPYSPPAFEENLLRASALLNGELPRLLPGRVGRFNGFSQGKEVRLPPEYRSNSVI
jgi:hypothetical protein